MAINLASTYSRKLDAPWSPIVYTSMRAWMIINYTLLLCLVALPALLIMEILKVLS